MYIRYQYVRNAIAAVGGLSVFSLCGLCSYNVATAPPEPAPPAEVARAEQPASSSPARETSAAASVTDAEIIARAQTPAKANDKIKDAFRGPIKVNIYEDTGDTAWDRVKVDRNRDEVWDEQWVLKGGQWTRDDGRDAWTGSGWASEGAAAKTDTPAAPAAELSEVVDLLLNQRATSDKIKDLKRGAGPKINVYDDDKDGRWDRAKVDHERDERWDESWTVKVGRVERKKEATGVVYLFDGGAWVEKKK
jgi:hypothetical protein